MSNDTSSKPLDLLGIAPVARAVEHVTEGSVRGAAAFLSRICLPAAEEFGHLLRDQVGAWRQRNAVRIAQQAEQLLRTADQTSQCKAPPRVVFQTLDHGSWIDDDHIQSMWAGLLASSCSHDGRDDSNLIFVDLMSQLTTSEAKLLSLACQVCTKEVSALGLVYCREPSYVPLSQLHTIAGFSDLYRLDRELDHLRSLELIDRSSGLNADRVDPVDITPTALALYLYVRASGFSGPPAEYFQLKADSTSQVQPIADALASK